MLSDTLELVSVKSPVPRRSPAPSRALLLVIALSTIVVDGPTPYTPAPVAVPVPVRWLSVIVEFVIVVIALV